MAPTRAHRFPIGAGQTVAVHLDADARAGQALFRQDVAQLGGGVGVLGVEPDADLLNRRSVARLGDVGPPAEKGARPRVCGQHGALKKHITAAIVAEEIVLAFLSEDQQGVEAAGGQRPPAGGQAAGVFAGLEGGDDGIGHGWRSSQG